MLLILQLDSGVTDTNLSGDKLGFRTLFSAPTWADQFTDPELAYAHPVTVAAAKETYLLLDIPVPVRAGEQGHPCYRGAILVYYRGTLPRLQNKANVILPDYRPSPLGSHQIQGHNYAFPPLHLDDIC